MKGYTPKKPKKNNSLLSLFQFGSKGNSAQNTLSYEMIYRDGICKLDEKRYTKTIQFYDVTYQLAKAEDKSRIFEDWCSFLNYFDSKVFFQLSFHNQTMDMEEYQKSILIPEQDDAFNEIRKEYADMLKEQLAKGNNGIQKTKYITFGIEADNLKTAKQRLERIEADIMTNFKMLGVNAHSLSGLERMSLLHQCLHQDENTRFMFHWDLIPQTGLSTKDYLAPNSFLFPKNGKYFKIGDTWCAVSFLDILASDIQDNLLKKMLDLDGNMVISFHIQPIDQLQAIKAIKRKITDIDAMAIEEQKKAVRSGYDYDNIPNNIKIYSAEAKKRLEDLQNRNERSLLVTILVMHSAKTKQELENNIFQTSGLLQQENCALRRLDYQQEQGFQSSLPFGLNKIEIQRSLTTSSTAVFIPFTTSELFQKEEALYYGINALSNNLIMANRKLLQNPNGLILGKPGSGKSFASKRELVNAFLCTTDDIVVVDPENEWSLLIENLGGQTINIAPASKDYINPMDINSNYSDDDDPITLKTDFIWSLCELIIGVNKEQEPIQRSIIGRCVKQVYQQYFLNPVPENMPILEDLYDCLNRQEEPQAKWIATSLEYYVTGAMNVFNHRTNIDIKNRLVCYNIKGLGKSLKKIGLLVIQDAVWNRVSANRDLHKSTRYYNDEMHLLLKDEQTASFTAEIWKRFRKWGGIPTGITQNVKDFLSSPEIENIFENTDFYYLLKQGPGDREILANKLNISSNQLAHITNSSEGEGLLIFGNTIIPFADHFPKDTKLYKIMTTKPSEMEDNSMP